MISAGNDIIDLKRIDIEGTGQVRFYSKILTGQEIELYNDCKILSFENFVWLLWSVKEAVFKYRKRNHTDLIFSPKKIVVQQVGLPKNSSFKTFGKSALENGLFDTANFFISRLQSDGECLHALSIVYTDLIFTTVTGPETAGNICWGIKYIDDESYESQSKQLREFLLARLVHLFTGEELGFEKTEPGYPVLIRNGKQADLPLSFAHHGNFIAYTFYNEPVAQ